MTTGETRDDGARQKVLPIASEQTAAKLLEAIKTRGAYILQVKVNPSWKIAVTSGKRPIRTTSSDPTTFTTIEATLLGEACEEKIVKQNIVSNDALSLGNYWGGA